MGAKTTFALINEPENWVAYLRAFEEKTRAMLLASINDAVEKQLEWQKGVPTVSPVSNGGHEECNNNEVSAGTAEGPQGRPMSPPTLIPAEMAREICAHVERARKESRRFVGRADELAEAMEVLFPQPQQQQQPPRSSQSGAVSTRGPIAVAAARSRLDMAGTAQITIRPRIPHTCPFTI